MPLYRVQVNIDANSRVFKGDEQIRYPTSSPLSQLVLRVFNDATYLSKDGSHPVVVTEVQCGARTCQHFDDPESTVVRIAFDPPVPAARWSAWTWCFKGSSLASIRKSRSSTQMRAQMSLVQTRGGAPTDHGAFGAGDGVLSWPGYFPRWRPAVRRGSMSRRPRASEMWPTSIWPTISSRPRSPRVCRWWPRARSSATRPSPTAATTTARRRRGPRLPGIRQQALGEHHRACRPRPGHRLHPGGG